MSGQEVAAPTPQEVVARETAGATRAGIAAAVGGVTLIAGAALNALATRDAPPVWLTDALRDASGQDIGRPALLGDRIEYLADHSAALVGSAALTAIGWLATALALSFLFQAARVRRPETPRWTAGLLSAGAVGLAVAVLMTYLALAIAAGDFGGADETSQSARDVLQGPVLLAGQLLRTMATLALALAFVFVAMNAMRAGLLTRFMGILGVIVGVLLVFPVGVGLPIVQTFWLVTLGLLLLGRIPGGRPPAWEAGVAVPWPSQQELAEQRARAREGDGGGKGPEAPAGFERPRAETPSPATSKKKRKRRS